MSRYNRDQWIESFEGQLSMLRPHLTKRVLRTMSLSAWYQHGTADRDPTETAREVSRQMDAPRRG